MSYERIYCVWVFFDEIRTGIANLNGEPHYFACEFDEAADTYTDHYRLYAVGPEFMQRAHRQWEIYIDWSRRFQFGETGADTHPRLSGADSEYLALDCWLNEALGQLQALPSPYTAVFRLRPGDEEPAHAWETKVEVHWSPVQPSGA